MCGIVGALAFGKVSPEKEIIRQEMMRVVTTELMLHTEERGEDATGAAVLWEDGRFYGIKRGVKSTTFLSRFGESADYYGSLLKMWNVRKVPAKVFIGHCRKGTVGDKEDNVNNHPIKVGNIVGVHNGVINNSDEIFKHLDCKRDGRVDSESIFRLFDYFTNKGKEPFTYDMLQEITTRLDGAFAIMAFNGDNPFQLPIMRYDRPVELVFIPQFGVLFVISELKFWLKTQFTYERLIHYYGAKLPTTFDMTVETVSMENGTARIFDLTKDCTKDTKIADLAENKKLETIKKMWQKYVTYNRGAYYGSGVYNHVSTNVAVPQGGKAENKPAVINTNKPAESKTTNASVYGGKRRIFDAVTKTYKYKDNDVVISDGQSAAITASVNPQCKVENLSEKAPTSTEDKNEVKSTTPTLTVVGKTQISLDADIYEGLSNDEVNELSGNPLDVEDTSQYRVPSTAPAKTDGIKVVDTKEAIDAKFELLDQADVISVDMSPDCPEAIALSEKVYKSLPKEKVGFSDVEDALDKLDVLDKEVGERLGPFVLANRGFKYGWLKGFVEAYKYISAINKDDKTEMRESYILTLKKMLLVFGLFFSKLKRDGFGGVDRVLKDILSSSQPLETKLLSNVFNSYEHEQMKPVIKTFDEIFTSRK
jgi:hypothetical protein